MADSRRKVLVRGKVFPVDLPLGLNCPVFWTRRECMIQFLTDEIESGITIIYSTNESNFPFANISNSGLPSSCGSSKKMDIGLLCPLPLDFDMQLFPTNSERSGEDMPIYVGHSNLAKEDSIYMKQLHLFPLKRVVFEARSNQSFLWANQALTSPSFILSVCKTKLVVAIGKSMITSYSAFSNIDGFCVEHLDNLIVKSSDPLDFGLISLNTEIIITSHTDEKVNDQSDQSINNRPLMISDFLVTKQYQNGQNKSEQSAPLKRLGPNPILLKAQLFAASDLKNIESRADHDTSSSIFISQATMVKFGVFDGCVVKVRVASDSAEQRAHPQTSKSQDKVNPFRYLAVKSLSDDLQFHTGLGKVEDDVVYIHPTLWINLIPMPNNCTAGKDCFVQLKRSVALSDSASISASRSLISCVPYASAVNISVINSPKYNVGKDFSHLIISFFKNPRILKQGDVLTIKSQDAAEGSGFDKEVIYFKVKSVTGKTTPHMCYLVDRNHTTVFQDGSMHSYAPTLVETDVQAPLPKCLHKYSLRLSKLINPYLHSSSGSNKDELTPALLVSGGQGVGKKWIINAAAQSMHLHVVKHQCHDLIGETSAASEARIKIIMEQAMSFSPCILLLENIQTLGKDPRDGTSEDARVAAYFTQMTKQLREKDGGWPVIVIATTQDSTKLTPDMNETFLHHVHIKDPDEAARQDLLQSVVHGLSLHSDVSISKLAQRTGGMVLSDMKALLSQVKKLAIRRVWQTCSSGRSYLSLEEEQDISLCGIRLQQADFNAALDAMQNAHSSAIGAPKIPKVKWEDVGGLGQVKSDILETVQLPLDHPELFSQGLRRSGILLYGPPGTGKTLMAKAVATECSLNFLSVKGPELINMYVGQSEENVRQVFKLARSAAPCIIFFDELDSLAPNRGRSGDSGGVMDRVVSQLLAELDGMHKSCDVFVIGATNRPDLLDPALLRPGRFDKLLYMGVSDSRSAQLNIFKALTRKFQLSEDCNLEEIVGQCPASLTGADIYAICTDAMLNGVKRKIAQLEQGLQVDDNAVKVEGDDFHQALMFFQPSVSEKDLAYFKGLQQAFSGKQAK